MLNQTKLELSQIVNEHPILNEKLEYRQKYIGILDYFVRNYSPNDPWALQTLEIYEKKIIGNDSSNQYNVYNLKKDIKKVIATKFHPFKFYTFRYCLLIDCIFICAIDDKEKGEKIFTELASVYRKTYQGKLQRVYESLYNPSISIDDIDQVSSIKKCWDSNYEFINKKPIKVIVTANMSAGKSTLLNALVGKKVNKTKNDTCTAKVHYIVNKPYEDNYCYELDHILDLNADYETLMEDNSDNENSEIIVGTYFRTIGTINRPVWLIDTPGVNSSQNDDHRELTEKVICNIDADLLIYLMNGENIGTEDDRKHLLFILEKYQGKVLFVVNKLDQFRAREDSVSTTLENVIKDLSEIGFENPMVVPISAYAAYLSKMKIFAEPLDEDDEYEIDRISRKMKKEEFQLDKYYPSDVQININKNSEDKNYQLLTHSGLLHLENIIYKTR